MINSKENGACNITFLYFPIYKVDHYGIYMHVSNDGFYENDIDNWRIK